MTGTSTRLDLQQPFKDMSAAIYDLAALTEIAVTVMESTIKDIPESFKVAGLRPQEGYITVVLTEDQYRSVHFINEHIRSIAQKAYVSLEAVEELIVEASR